MNDNKYKSMIWIWLY